MVLSPDITYPAWASAVSTAPPKIMSRVPGATLLFRKILTATWDTKDCADVVSQPQQAEVANGTEGATDRQLLQAWLPTGTSCEGQY